MYNITKNDQHLSTMAGEFVSRTYTKIQEHKMFKKIFIFALFLTTRFLRY